MPSWDPETETTASCRDILNRLSTRPSSGGGRDALTLSRSSSLSLWVAHPEASCSSAYCQLTGARMGGVACLGLAQRHRFWRRMQCGSRDGCRGPPSATSRLGAATGGRVEAAAARRGRTCWIASVCSCAAGNCWAMLPVASPKRPVWDTGTLRHRT